MEFVSIAMNYFLIFSFFNSLNVCLSYYYEYERENYDDDAVDERVSVTEETEVIFRNLCHFHFSKGSTQNAGSGAAASAMLPFYGIPISLDVQMSGRAYGVLNMPALHTIVHHHHHYASPPTSESERVAREKTRHKKYKVCMIFTMIVIVTMFVLVLL